MTYWQNCARQSRWMEGCPPTGNDPRSGVPGPFQQKFETQILKKQVFATHQRQEVGAWSSSKSQRIVLVDKQVLLTALNLEDDDEQK